MVLCFLITNIHLQHYHFHQSTSHKMAKPFATLSNIEEEDVSCLSTWCDCTKGGSSRSSVLHCRSRDLAENEALKLTCVHNQVFADDAEVQRLRQQGSRLRNKRRPSNKKLDDILGDEPHPLFANPPNMSSPNSSLPNLDMNRGASNASSVQGGQTNGNGNGAANYASPLPAGHQQDLNFLYGQIQELSAILAANREKTTELTKVAKEVQVRAHLNCESSAADRMQRRGLVPDMDALELGGANDDSVETDSKNTSHP